jgi:hypothetical protein
MHGEVHLEGREFMGEMRVQIGMRRETSMILVLCACFASCRSTIPSAEAGEEPAWKAAPATMGTPLAASRPEAEPFVPAPLGKKALQKKKLAEFGHTRETIEKTRAKLAKQWKAEKTDEQRRKVRDEARRFVVSTIVQDIFPAWMGTPWTMYAIEDGLKPDALYPHEEGKGTSCSYFVATVLVNAGLVLETRKKFAGGIASHIQRSLAPDEEDLHRWWKTTPGELEEKVTALGDGLYLVGLNCHIGFIVVEGKEARFVHASYLEPWKVVDEKLSKAEAIVRSEKSGYVVTALFQDDRLIEHWLTAEPVPFQEF